MIPGLPIKTAAVAMLALVMWVIPSLGTQGAGTIGHRISHPDGVLFGGSGAAETTADDTDALLRAADSVVRSAMSK